MRNVHYAKRPYAKWAIPPVVYHHTIMYVDEEEEKAMQLVLYL